MSARCDVYLENPEQHEDHLAECESCSRLAAGLEVVPPGRAAASIVSQLPIAPWEGAAHRAWGIVFVVGSAVLAGAFTLFLLAGVSPWVGFATALQTLLPRFDVLSVALSVAELLRGAPMGFHLFVVTAFVLINLLFVLLLRKPPKGYDITVR